MSAGPRAILGVRFGPLDGRRAVLSPGESLRVGRTAPSALMVPHDRQMSGVHFELSWDGARARVRDLASAGGTFLDDRRVTEGDLASGAFLRAGHTLFSFHVEGATARPLPPDSPEPAARKARALDALRAEPDPIFAVIDAARDRRALEILRESVEPYRSLYDGARGARMAEAAPHLVRLAPNAGGTPAPPGSAADTPAPPGGALLDRLIREGWEKSWGIYLASRRPFDEVRRHLRRLLMVDIEDEARPMYFRFYDPRVLRNVLPLCSPRQAVEMFGDVRCFVLEGAGGEVLRFTPPAA